MIAAGSRLGPYEILAPIGAGGMGEVYRARDPRLGREVAIKVLPASFSSDPDRLRRFEQEARAAGIAGRVSRSERPAGRGEGETRSRVSLTSKFSCDCAPLTPSLSRGERGKTTGS